MPTDRPTPAQIAALRLAARDAIRYYRGGWYSIPGCMGIDQHEHDGAHPLLGVSEAAAPSTLRACVARGWINATDPLIAHVLGRATIYDRRWTLTDAGRDVLAREEGHDGDR